MWSFQSIQSVAFNFHVPSPTKASLRFYQANGKYVTCFYLVIETRAEV